MGTAFVTGATGLIGGAVVDALLRQGVEVTALARTDLGAWALRDRGATTIRADIGESIEWDRAAQDAEVIFHLGLPRITPPVRGRHLRKLEREAQAGAEIIHDIAAGRNVVMGTCAIGDADGPLGIARPGLAAERVLVGPGVRVVRLPWAYGPSGFICDMSRGLQMRRFRVVGAGNNPIAVIGARDAAAAIIAASAALAGIYTVAEESMPTQVELVHLMCTTRGVPRPDHLPARMASMAMGGVIIEALTAHQRVEVAPPPGFTHSQRWDEDLMDALRS